MLMASDYVGDSDIPGIFVSSPKQLEEAQKRYGAHAVYLTEKADLGKILKKEQMAWIFVEKDGKDACMAAEYVWLADEDGELPDQNFLNRVWNRFFHRPWVIAETKRLQIRESVAEDAPALYRWYREEAENPDVMQPEEDMESQLQTYIHSRYPLFEYGLWTIVEKASGKVIGRGGLEELPEAYGDLAGEAELSYLIGTPYRQKGYGLECGRAILAYAKEELGIKTVYLRTSEENQASRALAENLGFLKVQSITEYREMLYSRDIDF